MAHIAGLQMVEMVHHCHSMGVMHRDIKPENFLLTAETDDADLKACDFGAGRRERRHLFAREARLVRRPRCVRAWS